MKFVAALAIAAATANGAWNSCSPGQYESALKSFAQGLQMNTDSTDTDCFRKVSKFTVDLRQFFGSFSNF